MHFKDGRGALIPGFTSMRSLPMTASIDTNSPMARDPRRVRSVVILGGGTAGWMTAAAVSRQFGRALRITLLDSEEIGISGQEDVTQTMRWKM